ncbi:MAG: phenylalanine 4-monooxygenase [Bdellovibrionales bacterium]|nr:phenylalanine 4-monooxygenase [Bdellovibrionales bacterium]
MTNDEDLTTTQAPFIEQAQKRGELFIEQPYHLYSEKNHRTWRNLYSRILPKWEKYAHSRFLEGVSHVALDSKNVPRIEDINQFLAPLSGFSAKAVSGYVPAYQFFDCLRQRAFPTTITIRDEAKLDYLPEPDIFHDAAGHVPMHTDRVFADTLVRFGEVARNAALLAQELSDKTEAMHRLESIIKGMARFFWFTVEFGLMKDKNEIKVYGSGLLSSYGEICHSIESTNVQRYPFQLEWVLNQYFEINHYQPLLFVIESFDQLFYEVTRLEQWILQGKLNSLSPGEPFVNEEDLRSFLEAKL